MAFCFAIGYLGTKNEYKKTNLNVAIRFGFFVVISIPFMHFADLSYLTNCLGAATIGILINSIPSKPRGH